MKLFLFLQGWIKTIRSPPQSSLFLCLCPLLGLKLWLLFFLWKTEVVGSKYLSYFSDFSPFTGEDSLFSSSGCDRQVARAQQCNLPASPNWHFQVLPSSAASAQRSLQFSFILLSVFLKTKPNSQLDHIKSTSILLWLSPLLWPSLQSSH